MRDLWMVVREFDGSRNNSLAILYFRLSFDSCLATSSVAVGRWTTRSRDGNPDVDVDNLGARKQFLSFPVLSYFVLLVLLFEPSLSSHCGRTDSDSESWEVTAKGNAFYGFYTMDLSIVFFLSSFLLFYFKVFLIDKKRDKAER